MSFVHFSNEFFLFLQIESKEKIVRFFVGEKKKKLAFFETYKEDRK